MVDHIEKYLRKLRDKESIMCEKIILDIYADQIDPYDVKKLSGYKDLYRIRKGKIRIIFRKDNRFGNAILKVSDRNENTYKEY